MSTPNLPATPSKPPAADGNMGAMLALCFNKLLQRTDGQLPAEIVSYNRATNLARVQPLISVISTSGQRVGRAPIVSVPVVAHGGGGFFIGFPLVKGNLGWIEASDRDISLFLQTAQMSPPNTKILHSFDNGRFMPDVFDGYTFTLDANAMVISSLDGTTRIVLGPGKISLIAPTVEIDTTTFNLNASGVATLNAAALNINTTGGGGTTGTGTFNLPASTIIDGRPFPTHEHTNGNGGANTGGVV